MIHSWINWYNDHGSFWKFGYGVCVCVCTTADNRITGNKQRERRGSCNASQIINIFLAIPIASPW